jgi:hypothetical protein
MRGNMLREHFLLQRIAHTGNLDLDLIRSQLSREIDYAHFTLRRKKPASRRTNRKRTVSLRTFPRFQDRWLNRADGGQGLRLGRDSFWQTG